jgi:hypothetical protein
MTTNVLLVRDFLKPLWDINDRAHDINHADDVATRGEYFAIMCGITERGRELVGFSAYLHDVTLRRDGRERHHIGGAEFARTFQHQAFNVTPEERELVAQAIFEHRASHGERKFSSQIAEVLACSDISAPYYGEILARILETAPTLEEAKKHMVEKFGRNGYLKYPNLYMLVYHKELEVFYTQIEKNCVH